MTTKKDDVILSSGALQREEIRIGMSAAAIRQEILDNLTYRG